jgi:hypothetical protein
MHKNTINMAPPPSNLKPLKKYNTIFNQLVGENRELLNVKMA